MKQLDVHGHYRPCQDSTETACKHGNQGKPNWQHTCSMLLFMAVTAEGQKGASARVATEALRAGACTARVIDQLIVNVLCCEEGH